MSTAQHDTEITLGTGRMLAIFFTFVLVCAFFFAIGFSLGRKTTLASAGNWPSASTGAPSTVVRPSAAKNDAAQATPQPTSSDFSFYKAVGEKTAEAGSTPPDSPTQASAAQNAKTQPAVATTETPVNGGADVAPVTAGYYVQVAAVSRKEDAEALVDALKKKQYPAFSANNPPTDKFYHVQVGPYADLKDAEGMRNRLIGDGYNPIVKK
jgi:cell division septation protein DedD